MEVVKVGQIIDEHQKRDAIHVAIAPMIASERLSPGQDVGIVGKDRGIAGPSIKPLGIVDPYLKCVVLPGERFWLFLYPNTVTSLRHEWTHPAFFRRSEARATEEANVS